MGRGAVRAIRRGPVTDSWVKQMALPHQKVRYAADPKRQEFGTAPWIVYVHR